MTHSKTVRHDHRRSAHTRFVAGFGAAATARHRRTLNRSAAASCWLRAASTMSATSSTPSRGSKAIGFGCRRWGSASVLVRLPRSRLTASPINAWGSPRGRRRRCLHSSISAADTTSDMDDIVIGAKTRMLSENNRRPAVALRFATRLPKRRQRKRPWSRHVRLHQQPSGRQDHRLCACRGEHRVGNSADPTRGDRQNDVVVYGLSLARAMTGPPRSLAKSAATPTPDGERPRRAPTARRS